MSFKRFKVYECVVIKSVISNINQKRKLHEGTVVTLQKCKNMVIKS